MANTHYIYPYTGDDLPTVIGNAAGGDTIILMPGNHMLEIPSNEWGVPFNKSLTIEGRIGNNGVLPIVEVYNPQVPKAVFFTNDGDVAVLFKRIIFRHWGQRSVVNTATWRYLVHANTAFSVHLDQVAIIGPTYTSCYGNKPAGILAGNIGANGVSIRNCTFANLNVALRVVNNSGQCAIDDCIFQNIHEYVLSMYNNQDAVMRYCNFDVCPTPRHQLGVAASVTENDCTEEETRMYGSKSIIEGLYNINRLDWEKGSAKVYLLLGVNRAVFGYYQYSCGVCGGNPCYYQGPDIFLTKTIDVSIDANVYKHVYVGAVTCFREGEGGVQRPALKWKHLGNWYSEPWDWNDGYVFDDTIQDMNQFGPMHGTPLIVLHKDMTNNSDWIGTLTQLTYAPFNENNPCANGLRWTALGFIIVSKYEFQTILSGDDLYERLIQIGFGYLLPTDSQLVNAGNPTVYDEWMSPHYLNYIGQLGPLHDIGAYGGVTQTPYIDDRPFFETLSPTDDYTATSLPSVSIHLKQSPITFIPVDWSSIQVEAFGNIYTQASPTDSNATLTLTGDLTDVLITLTLTDNMPGDPFVVIFRGADSTGEGADPYAAAYYLWEGKGTIAHPFEITPDTGIMAYEKPQLVLKRWAHCYDQIRVTWGFEDDTNEIVRGLSSGSRKLLSLADNPLIQTPNLGGHSADLLLEKFGKERKEISQTLPFSPFIDPYDILRLLYPSKHYLIDRSRKWVVSELRLSPKTGKVQLKGLESHES